MCSPDLAVLILFGGWWCFYGVDVCCGHDGGGIGGGGGRYGGNGGGDDNDEDVDYDDDDDNDDEHLTLQIRHSRSGHRNYIMHRETNSM